MMLAALAAVTLAQTFPATTTRTESPRNMIAEIRAGTYYPWIDRPLQTCYLTSCPYYKTFSGSPMVLVELEVERELFQKFGVASLGATMGYAEKFAHATTLSGDATSEATGLRMVPMKVLGSYRFDWLVQRFGVPLAPYVKVGFEVVYWWATKGKGTEVFEGVSGNGWSYGVVGAGGLAFLLDVLDPRLARDFDTGIGVNHTYLFAEFNIAEVNNFGAKLGDGVTAAALDLSSRFMMFGLAFEF